MYYYYDILLNFGEGNALYEFYEWEETDNIDFIKKIPLFRVSSTSLKEHLKYRLKYDKDFLEQIKNKTIVKSSSKVLEYTFLICDTKNALALELNKEGEVINRSKLLLNDEINLSEIMFTMKETKLKYERLEKYKKRSDIRQIEKMKKLIKCEIDTLYESNNISKLKYIYYEWFNKTAEDIKIMVQEMNTILQKNDDENLERIYTLIKMSYHKVN